VLQQTGQEKSSLVRLGPAGKSSKSSAVCAQGGAFLLVSDHFFHPPRKAFGSVNEDGKSNTARSTAWPLIKKCPIS
jgi:hypothetical protein